MCEGETVKVKLLKPQSSDAGTYTGLPEDKIQWGEVVSARYCDKIKGVYIKGEDFMKLGALEEHFVADREYVWGCYEEVE